MLRIPILTYHEISDQPHALYRRFTVTPAQFRRQMAWLAARGYRTVSPSDLWASRSGTPLPAKPVVLTFDDACRAALATAMSVLPPVGFTATFFVVTGRMGAFSDWSSMARAVRVPLIDWRTARELAAAGFSCGSHTVSHRRLTELPPAECRKELVRSRAKLTDRLGRDVVDVSYPFGALDDSVEALAAEAGYRTGFGSVAALASSSDRLLALPRVTVPGNASFLDFVLRIETGRTLRHVLDWHGSLAARLATTGTGCDVSGRQPWVEGSADE